MNEYWGREGSSAGGENGDDGADSLAEDWWNESRLPQEQPMFEISSPDSGL